MSTQSASVEMIQLLRALRKKVAIGVVGGSDLVKISEQLAVDGATGESYARLQYIYNALESKSQPSRILTIHLRRTV